MKNQLQALVRKWRRKEEEFNATAIVGNFDYWYKVGSADANLQCVDDLECLLRQPKRAAVKPKRRKRK